VIPRENWRWFGRAHPDHTPLYKLCRFHLTTHIGPWVISTVGDYHSLYDIAKDAGDSKACPLYSDETMYETKVFVTGAVDPSGDHLPRAQGEPVASHRCHTPGEANRAHYRLCYEWARRGRGWPSGAKDLTEWVQKETWR
jgi:hypothetical protein